ncbi:MAG: hypothetical protein ABIZ70_08580 [Gemmatimonadales bacterium]
MTRVGDEEWVISHTTGAPTRLREQVVAHFRAASAAGLTLRLAEAGDAALAAATAAGRGRDTALDLLAADALITLALLATAERSPETLAADAAMLRFRAVAA